MLNPTTIEKNAATLLLSLLPGEWTLIPDGERKSIDFHLVGASCTLVVEVTHSTRRSAADVQARIALSLLRLQKFGPLNQQVVAVHVPEVSPRLWSDTAKFIAEYALQCGILLFDDAGHLVAKIPQLDISIARYPDISNPTRMRRDPALFSDLNRWMLKILLLAKCPENWWGGPRTMPIPHSTALAHVAQVSVAKAHQFTAALSPRGWLRRTSSGIEIADVQELLRVWIEMEALERDRQIPCQWILGSRGDLSPFSNYDGLWALAGFAACKELGVLHTDSPELPEVHLFEESALRKMDLVPVEDVRSAHVLIKIPRYPESVFRGRVKQKGMWYVDILQAALDVLGQQRGREQAEYIINRLTDQATA